jgi:hypothetical protein
MPRTTTSQSSSPAPAPVASSSTSSTDTNQNSQSHHHIAIPLPSNPIIPHYFSNNNPDQYANVNTMNGRAGMGNGSNLNSRHVLTRRIYSLRPSIRMHTNEEGDVGWTAKTKTKLRMKSRRRRRRSPCPSRREPQVRWHIQAGDVIEKSEGSSRPQPRQYSFTFTGRRSRAGHKRKSESEWESNPQVLIEGDGWCRGQAERAGCAGADVSASFDECG